MAVVGVEVTTEDISGLMVQVAYGEVVGCVVCCGA